MISACRKWSLCLLVLLSLLTACQPAEEPTTTPAPPPTDTPVPPPPPTAELSEPAVDSTEVVLTVTGPDQIIELTLADLQAMPAYEGWGGIKNSTGKITVPAVYKGVPLHEIVALVGGVNEADGLSVVAEDGYAMTLAYNQVYDDNYVKYDPGTGDETDKGGELIAVIAYELDGQPLPKDSEGTLRLVVLGENNSQVTDGHWWVKWVNAVTVKGQGEEWYLSLNGVIAEEMDRATFESCSSPSCHGTSWTDDEGHEWTGTPLYLIAARVDDENKHDFGGFNVELAEAGYIIQLVAADGYAVEIESGAASRNQNMIVAINRDGEPLPEEFYPLRLVGSDLQKNQMVSQLAEVSVILQPQESEEGQESGETSEVPSGDLTQVSAEDAALTVTGLVEQDLALSMDSLHAELEVVQINTEHPQNGTLEDYEGVRLADLLAYATPMAKASSVVFTAIDGYLSEVDLAEALACEDCLVGFNNQGTLKMVMPGMESMAWVKDVVSIELK